MWVIFSLIGLVMLGFGLYVRAGGAKVWYLARGIPVVMPQVVQNMAIPLGITVIVFGFILSPELFPSVEMRQTLFGYIVMPMLGITIVLGIWNPRWMRPRWLVYLHDKYGEGATRLMFDVAAENGPEWMRRVRTQEGLEEWAEETYQNLWEPTDTIIDE